jgi:hypothetical protein
MLHWLRGHREDEPLAEADALVRDQDVAAYLEARRSERDVITVGRRRIGGWLRSQRRIGRAVRPASTARRGRRPFVTYDSWLTTSAAAILHPLALAVRTGWRPVTPPARPPIESMVRPVPLAK